MGKNEGKEELEKYQGYGEEELYNCIFDEFEMWKLNCEERVRFYSVGLYAQIMRIIHCDCQKEKEVHLIINKIIVTIKKLIQEEFLRKKEK